MSRNLHFREVQHFTTGTIGPKGQRIFFLQFGNSGELMTLQLEKMQIRALAEFLDQLIGDVEPIHPDDVPIALELIEPVQPEWAVSSIGVAFEEDNSEFVIVAEEQSDESDPSVVQIHLSPGQVKAFIIRATDVVRAGRPPCTYCGEPLNHSDGWCPCSN
jgi:uncharacterized repeat protein (TIGR03847 family)